MDVCFFFKFKTLLSKINLLHLCPFLETLLTISHERPLTSVIPTHKLCSRQIMGYNPLLRYFSLDLDGKSAIN